jgi:hypothetical protein
LGATLVVLDVYRPPFVDDDFDVLLQAESGGRWAA